MVTISELTTALRPLWDEYVCRAPAGLPTHLSAWRDVLARTYGYQTAYLLALEGDRPVGVLPLFLVASRLMGRTATTMPGGLCADSPAVAAQLIAQGQEQARTWGAARFRLHDTRQCWPGEWRTSTHHEHWLVELCGGPAVLWERLDGNLRRQVRKARRNQLSIEIGRSPQLQADFYEVFSRFTHQAGTPVFGRAFLAAVVEAFPDSHSIAVVRHESRPVAAYFQLEMGRRMTGLWGAALHQYLALRPVHLALWSIMKDAAERGFTCLDMGRSPAGSNASAFKGQWGGVRAPIHQQLYSPRKAEYSDPVTDGIQSDGQMKLFMRLWPRLPLPLAQALGPRLRRHLPFA